MRRIKQGQKTLLAGLMILTVFMSVACNNAKSRSSGKVRPNVILILADDLGAGDLGCAGHPYVKTPNIDQLAAEGISFTRAYVAASWCSPTRYSIMRGLFPGREFYNTYNLMPDQPTVTKIMSDAGYATAHLGKWHMSKGKEISESPGDFGIDKHFTTSSNGPGWSASERKEPYHRAKTSEKYVDMAIDFIKDNDAGPFYIHLWVHPTHSYIDPSPEQLQEYQGLTVDINDFESSYQQDFLRFVARHGNIDSAMQAYCADVTGLDKAIGKLMDYLQKSGLADNTLIVFTSDNGPGPLTDQIKNRSVVERYEKKPTLLNSVGSSGIFRDRKLSIHEGGIHVPYIVRWPGPIPAGKVDTETIICSVDWLQTISSVCDIKLPESNFDGQDMSASLFGEITERKKNLYWLENNGQAAMLEGDWKGVLYDNTFSLYNLNNDPGERHDLSHENLKMTKEIKSKLEIWLNSLATN